MELESSLTVFVNHVACFQFNIENETVAVFVASTTGDGDPPDAAQKFWRRLKKKTLAKTYLQHLKYALLGAVFSVCVIVPCETIVCVTGLGDSNYTNFCNFSKMLNKRLLELGATAFFDTGYADDAVGYVGIVSLPHSIRSGDDWHQGLGQRQTLTLWLGSMLWCYRQP